MKRSLTAGVILGAADFVGQALERNDKSSGDDVGDQVVDLARVARFAFFGFILQVRNEGVKHWRKKVEQVVLIFSIFP